MSRRLWGYEVHWVVVVLILVSCVSRAKAHEAHSDEDIQALGSDFYNWQMSRNPTESTFRGMSLYNDQMKKYGLEQLDLDKNITLEFMARLESIDKTKLNKSNVVNYEILKNVFQTFLDGNIWARYGAVNPISDWWGIHIHNRPYMPRSANTVQDFENYIKRLLAVQNQVDGIKELMRFSIQNNRTLHNASMAYVIQSLDALIFNTSEESSFFKAVFETKLNSSGINETKQEDLKQMGRNAVMAFMNAHRDLRSFLLKEYLPNTRSEWGLWSVDPTNGFYQACLTFHLSVHMEPAEVHSLGLQEVTRIKQEMNETLQNLGFNGTSTEFYESLKDDARFYTNNRTEILQYFNETVFNTILPTLTSYFSYIPDDPLEITGNNASAVLAFYRIASADGPGRFTIGLLRPNDSSLAETMAVSLHETYPGHHLQLSIARGANLPQFRRSPVVDYMTIPNWFPFYTAYIEGWGLYSEYLGEEMGLYRNDYEKMGRYTLEILRACRLVVDTGIHYMRWTRPYAVQYLMNCTSYGQAASEVEIDRYITLPGQACSYKIGEIKIQQLRKMAENELGSNFEIKRFHKVVLENGAMSLSLLETLVEDWIETEKAGNDVNAAPRDQFHTHWSVMVVSLCFYAVLF